MSKGMPRASQKYKEYGVGKDLTQSFVVPKSTEISLLFHQQNEVLKKRHTSSLSFFKGQKLATNFFGGEKTMSAICTLIDHHPSAYIFIH